MPERYLQARSLRTMCRDNRSVLYQRVPKLFPELALARGDGRYARILRGLTGVQLRILDDWGLEPLDAGARRDLYEILEERYGRIDDQPPTLPKIYCQQGARQPGDIISERRAISSRNQRATS
jgi:hypothetical protein